MFAHETKDLLVVLVGLLHESVCILLMWYDTSCHQRMYHEKVTKNDVYIQVSEEGSKSLEDVL